MATAVQRRRGSTADHAAFTALAGEITVDTSKGAVVVHDGTTAGGSPQATEAALNQHAEDTQAHGISAFGASLVDDADAATARATLGLGDSAILDVGTDLGTVAAGNHHHVGIYEPVDATLLRSADIGTGPGTVSAGDHLHTGVYEPADETILKAADIGTDPGSVAAGDHDHGGDAASLGSGNAGAGQVLMADGSGGASWSAQARITVAATAPESPALHDLWVDIG